MTHKLIDGYMMFHDMSREESLQIIFIPVFHSAEKLLDRKITLIGTVITGKVYSKR